MSIIKIVALLLMNSILVEFGLIENDNMIRNTLKSVNGSSDSGNDNKEHIFISHKCNDRTITFVITSDQNTGTEFLLAKNVAIVRKDND